MTHYSVLAVTPITQARATGSISDHFLIKAKNDLGLSDTFVVTRHWYLDSPRV